MSSIPSRHMKNVFVTLFITASFCIFEDCSHIFHFLLSTLNKCNSFDHSFTGHIFWTSGSFLLLSSSLPLTGMHLTWCLLPKMKHNALPLPCNVRPNHMQYTLLFIHQNNFTSVSQHEEHVGSLVIVTPNGFPLLSELLLSPSWLYWIIPVSGDNLTPVVPPCPYCTPVFPSSAHLLWLMTTHWQLLWV